MPKYTKLFALLLLLLLFAAVSAWAYPPHRGGRMGQGSSSAPPTAVLSGIALSNRSFSAPGSDGAVVGAITVQGSGNLAAVVLSIAGTNASSFRLSNTTTPSNLLVSGTQQAGTYSINLVATLAGATGSPFTQVEAITGTAVTVSSVSITCGANCSFQTGTGGTIGTASATLSTGSPTGTFALQTNGTDHSGTVCQNYGADFSITSAGALSNSASAPAQSYPGVCIQYNQTGVGNSPYTQAFNITGISLGAGLFVATNGTNNSFCTIGSPCTLAAAQTAAQNGNLKLIYVRGGTYRPPGNGCGGVCVLDLSVNDHDETWQYYPPDGIDSAIIDGQAGAIPSNAGLGYCFNLGSHNQTITGIHCRNFNQACVHGVGDQGSGSNNLIQDNEFENCSTTPNCCSIPAVWAGDGMTVIHNYIHTTGQQGIIAFGAGGNVIGWNYINGYNQTAGDGAALYADQGSGNTWKYNYITNCLFGQADGCFGLYNDDNQSNDTGIGNIYVSLLWSCHYFHGLDSGARNDTDTNFICDQSTEPFGQEHLYRYYLGTGNRITNGIVIAKSSGSSAGTLDCLAPNVSQCDPVTTGPNVYFNYSSGGVNTINDVNPKVVDPQFDTCPTGGVDSWSYKLKATSPALASPINMTQPNNDRGIAWGMPGFWGPVGFVIPHTGPVPSYGPCQVSITGVTLSNSTFTGGAAGGTVVGAITVQGTGVGGAILSITGTDAARFSLSSTTVPSNLLLNGTQTAGSYAINLVATQSGATGSPFSQPETIVGSGVTLNPSDKAANVVLSSGNLTATTNGGSWGAVRSTANYASGKAYLEETVSQVNSSGGNFMPLGLSTASASLTTVTPSGTLLFAKEGGQLILNGVYQTSTYQWAGAPTGHTVALAVDETAQKAWAKDLTAGTGWNVGSTGSQDPGTGVGGFPFSGNALNYFYWSDNGAQTPHDIGTVNFGGSAFSGTIPCGFNSWDGSKSGAVCSGNVFTPITGDASYKLVFDDEFNGLTIDTTTNWLSSPNGSDTTYSGRTAQYIPANRTAHNGCADLQVTAGPTPNGSSYGTGSMTSKASQSTGYYEARIKTSSGNADGLAATYWIDANPNFTYPEIDFLEWWGFQPTTDHQTWHFTNDGTNGVGITHAYTGLNLQSSWHVLGVFWTSSAITWYVDGVQTFTTTNGVASNLATEWLTILIATVGPSGAGNNVDGNTVFPFHQYVDYVHVYSNASGAVAVTPQANYGGPGDAVGNTTCS